MESSFRPFQLLIFIPTYNERENALKLYREIRAIGLEGDLLFVDDASPDGTGALLDSLKAADPHLFVVHRSGKLGIGSAHREGIHWAYQRRYELLVTMDCDFTHEPAEICRFIKGAEDHDVVVGSRYMRHESLSDWNLFRRFLTHLGHFLTRHLLAMPYDASGAFRAYRLDRIPKGVFDRVLSNSYSFFFESLHILCLNGHGVLEIPIRLPKRTYGHSKMRLADAWGSFMLLLSTWRKTRMKRNELIYTPPVKRAASLHQSTEEVAWDEYWNKKQSSSKIVYDLIATLYRIALIRPLLNAFVRKEFASGARVLHAGCGGGQVDSGAVRHARVTALDISVPALERYKRLHGARCEILHGSIFSIPCPDAFFDGVYNLGVMEHFTESDILRILNEFGRVLRPDGKIVLFWPPERGVSVIFLKGVHFVLNRIMKKNISLHPDEITRLQSREHARRLLEASGFVMTRHAFGPRDLFTYAVVVGRKAAHSSFAGRSSQDAVQTGSSI